LGLVELSQFSLFHFSLAQNLPKNDAKKIAWRLEYILPLGHAYVLVIVVIWFAILPPRKKLRGVWKPYTCRIELCYSQSIKDPGKLIDFYPGIWEFMKFNLWFLWCNSVLAAFKCKKLNNEIEFQQIQISHLQWDEIRPPSAVQAVRMLGARLNRPQENIYERPRCAAMDYNLVPTSSGCIEMNPVRDNTFDFAPFTSRRESECEESEPAGAPLSFRYMAYRGQVDQELESESGYIEID
jgi:hypothetical protein